MPRQVVLAAAQMDVTPAPTRERLRRAERLVVDAATSGADLVVLPELFNTGYTYAEDNYGCAEALDGPTAAWMRGIAARFKVHLAGSLMVRERGEIYNALLLYAPDGRTWRYDKLYPWGWERAYFRRGRGTTVAATALGRIGMMICWDVAHLCLWRRYAGQVDLMLIASSPPDVSNGLYRFPSGEALSMDGLRHATGLAADAGQRTFAGMLAEQTAWLGVPAVNAGGTGQVATGLPNGLTTVLAMSPLVPRLLRYAPQAQEVVLSCAMVPCCGAFDAAGQVVAERTPEQGETFALAEVTLRRQAAQPRGPQPRARLPLFSYLASDILLPWLSVPAYQRGVRRARS